MKKSLLLTLRASLVFMLCLGLSSCTVVRDQSYASKGLQRPTQVSAIMVKKSLTLKFQRGLAKSDFEVQLPAGRYPAIAETPEQTFYLAPAQGFDYKMNGWTESRLGGLVLTRKKAALPRVWFFPLERNTHQHARLLDGRWISDVRPGLSGLLTRPWIERDFIVPAEALIIP